MTISFSMSVHNVIGEKLIFHRVQNEPCGDKFIVENFVEPGAGPLIHTHLLQANASPF